MKYKIINRGNERYYINEYNGKWELWRVGWGCGNELISEHDSFNDARNSI